MKERSPCLGCKHRSPGCQSRCEMGKKYWARQQERNEVAKIAQAKDRSYDTYRFDRIRDTMKKAGLTGR